MRVASSRVKTVSFSVESHNLKEYKIPSMSDEFRRKSIEVEKWYHFDEEGNYIPKEGTPEDIKILYEQLKKEYKKSRIL